MRLKILSADEIDALYERPRFTQEERDEYFTLSAQEKAALGQLHSLKSKMFFILQLGYFKARRMFLLTNPRSGLRMQLITGTAMRRPDSSISPRCWTVARMVRPAL